MPERVKIDGGGGRNAELFGKITPAFLDLAHKALAGGQVAVRLQMPAAHDVPFARFDQVPDARKQRRFVFFRVAVEQRLVVAENVTVEFLAEPDRTAERGECGGGALLPFPLPDRIQVCVADQIKRFPFHAATPFWMGLVGLVGLTVWM